MLPAEQGKRTDKLPTSNGEKFFNPKTITSYRKLAAHSNRLNEYYESIDDEPTQGRSVKPFYTSTPKALPARSRALPSGNVS